MNLTAALVNADKEPLTVWGEIDFYLCGEGHLHQREGTSVELTCVHTGMATHLRFLDLETPADDCEVVCIPFPVPLPVSAGMMRFTLTDYCMDAPTPG